MSPNTNAKYNHSYFYFFLSTALQKLRGANADISAEIEEMKAEYVKNVKANASQKITTIDILKLRRPEWKMAILLGAGVQLAIQLSGFSTVGLWDLRLSDPDKTSIINYI